MQAQDCENIAELHCPHCGSTELVFGTRGFSWGRALLGALFLAPLAGPVGILGGFVGRNDRMAACCGCGQKWAAPRQEEQQQ